MGRQSVFDSAARDEFIKMAHQHRLSNQEIEEIVALIEQGDDPIESPAGEFGSLALAAQNPAYAVAQFRMLVARISELYAVADHAQISSALQQPGQATELERGIWQEFEKTRSHFQ